MTLRQEMDGFENVIADHGMQFDLFPLLGCKPINLIQDGVAHANFTDVV